jgi:hypothetical protein
MSFFKTIFVLLLAAPIFCFNGDPGATGGVQVHEWGTFTSVAGETGAPQVWAPLTVTSDLPCFVYHLGHQNVKAVLPAAPSTRPVPTSTVRMETPVLYFYSPKQTTLSVSVDFPQGWITEWYPNASIVQPEVVPGALLPAVGKGHIEWSQVTVAPEKPAPMSRGAGSSRYYAARNADSQNISVQQQGEKVIFYRGIANFPVPLWVKLADDSQLELKNVGSQTLPLAIVFENHGGKVGYRMLRELSGTSEARLPELTGSQADMEKDLGRALVDMGLYEKEAAAMLETWRDSWFEEGMRVFYLMPRRSLDAVLPVHITPSPEALQRVFVGRVEVLSPHIRETLRTALSTGDTATLSKYGRFLQPFAERFPGATTNPATSAFFQSKRAEAEREFSAPSCVR